MNKFKQVEGSNKEQWKTTKEELGWNKNLSLAVITRDGKTLTTKGS